MSFEVPPKLDKSIDERIKNYPEKRSASLMLLHALQEHFGWISQDAIEYVARKLEMKPLHVYELVTFYPMFRQDPAGKYVIKVCRTLSCMLGGSADLFKHFCDKLGMDPKKHGLQTSADGKFSVEFVECLASCGTAPVMMINNDFHEGVSIEKADHLMGKCK
jgi:NADH-quinone oxidoreductase subunit E